MENILSQRVIGQKAAIKPLQTPYVGPEWAKRPQ